jgi:hypothetical protein
MDLGAFVQASRPIDSVRSGEESIEGILTGANIDPHHDCNLLYETKSGFTTVALQDVSKSSGMFAARQEGW